MTCREAGPLLHARLDNELDMASSAGEMLETVGYKNVRTYMDTSYPGNANHEMGTARMGRDPKTSVLNAFNQMHAVKNVFITMAQRWYLRRVSILR